VASFFQLSRFFDYHVFLIITFFQTSCFLSYHDFMSTMIFDPIDLLVQRMSKKLAEWGAIFD
jgi:hypothetical protein